MEEVETKRIVCLIVVLTAAMPGVVKAEPPVDFTDPKLKACVEAALGIKDPTPTDMLGLTSRSCTYSGIVDLTGLEYATNLTGLNLGGNKITDISALAGLTNLTSLELYSNQISDISAVAGLTNLVALWLQDNPLNQDACDIYIPQILQNNPGIDLRSDCGEPVYFADANLKAAVEQALRITDPTPSDMLGLTLFACYKKGIVDLNGLEYATNLTWLELYNNQISDISAVAGLTNLTSLHLKGNQISDISTLSGLTNLTRLDLYHNQISDISAVSGLTNLTYLNLGNNQISDIDISAVAGLTNLTNLYLYNNQISDISALAGLTNLRKLCLYGNQVSDISAVSGLTNLTELDLGANPLNADAYNVYIPQILENNPGITLYYDQPTLHTLTISSTTGGSVTTPGEGPYPYVQGTVVQVTAQAEANYHFMEWTVTGVDAGKVADPNAASTTVTMSANYTLQANFAIDQHTLDISSGTGGRVVTPGEGTFQYDHGQEITLEAEAEPGYHFTNWSGSLSSTRNPVTITMNHDYQIEANFAITPITIYVDDNAPNDPEQNNPAISDPNEDGSAEHPFDMIQEGIDAALDDETVIVRDGTYREAIEFAGRNITVTAFDPNKPNAVLPYPVIDANYIGTAVTFCHKEEPNCILEGFVITRGAGEFAGGINCVGSSPTISHCLIVGNRVMDPNGGGGAVFCIDSNAVFENCTFSGNYGGEQGAGLYLCDSNAVLLNCIVWDNLPYQIAVACGLDPNITFSDVQDTWPGQGNIDIAPCFAELGYWADANNQNIAVEPSEANAVWVGGDYHLKSQAGRWERYSASWVIDDVTSLCIDAGEPNSDWTAELWPRGKRINMGAYGGTPQASMSLSTVAEPLSEALDTALSFTTSGSADWFSQTKTSYHDGDAAQSGDISDEQESWMQTTVSGKGTVRFYWMVSSEEDFDFLEFYIDGSLEDQISGSVNWQKKTYTISTSDSHTLEWRYMKDEVTSFGDDCGWVDKVEWITTP